MIKTIIVSVVAFFAFTGVASAASFTNVQFQNGDVTVQGVGGQTVHATFRIVVGPGEVVEFIQTDVVGDSLAPVDHPVGGPLGLQEGTHNVTLPVVLPPNTGTYTLTVQGTGIYGALAAVDGSSPVVGSASFAGALRVVASGNTSGGVGSSVEEETNATLSAIDNLIALIQAWFAAQQTATTTPAPEPAGPGYCPELDSFRYLGPGAPHGQVIGLQSLLADEGFMTHAEMATGPGIYGPKTTRAHNVAKLSCS